jgi:DNA transformation protein
MTDDLENTINIGPILAGELRAAGIATPDELQALGAVEAWERVRRVNPERDCVHSLLALEGAVRGVRWMRLAPEERQRLARYAEARRMT